MKALMTPVRSRLKRAHISWPGERPVSAPFLPFFSEVALSGPRPGVSVLVTAVWDGLVIAKCPRAEFSWNMKRRRARRWMARLSQVIYGGVKGVRCAVVQVVCFLSEDYADRRIGVLDRPRSCTAW